MVLVSFPVAGITRPFKGNSKNKEFVCLKSKCFIIGPTRPFYEMFFSFNLDYYLRFF